MATYAPGRLAARQIGAYGTHMARDTTASTLVAAEIRAELARRQLSKTWLADQVGAERTSFIKKISGTRELLIDDVWKCARALEVPVVDLLPSEEPLAA